MRERVAPLGDKNIVGATVTRLRLEQGITQKALMAKMQTFGADQLFQFIKVGGPDPFGF